MTNPDPATLEQRLTNLELLVLQLIRRDAQTTYDQARVDGAEHAQAVQATITSTRGWTQGLEDQQRERVLRAVARMFEN